MIVGIGIDLCAVARVRARLAVPAADWREVVFTAAEVARCEARPDRDRHYAALFAAKEATLKALARAGGRGWFWLDVEIDERSRLVLRGRLRELADGLGVEHAHVAMAHTQDLAVAAVVLEDTQGA
jgi:holo-[acyl-carrier protein] synthase